MSSNNYQIYIDCGFSKLRAGAFSKLSSKKAFYTQSKFLFDHTDLNQEIQKIITFLEKETNEYIDDINLMIDSPKALSVSLSVFKKIDGPKLQQDDVQFLIQEAKQQILKYYNNQKIIHIIINNYKIDDVEYDYLPEDIKCDFISLNILFICLPQEVIEYYKSFFHKFHISIKQIACSSYAKAINYKNSFLSHNEVSFIDCGFNKTSITTYANNKIISLNILPIGGNHITKDISKILKIDLEQAENLKLNFGKDKLFLNDKNPPPELLQNVIFARIEEILEMCVKSIELNLTKIDQYKMILMGEGSKILDNEYKDKISFANDIDFLDETMEDICQSGFKLGMGVNKQEVKIVPKKQIKQGFFEKLFHFYK